MLSMVPRWGHSHCLGCRCLCNSCYQTILNAIFTFHLLSFKWKSSLGSSQLVKTGTDVSPFVRVKSGNTIFWKAGTPVLTSGWWGRNGLLPSFFFKFSFPHFLFTCHFLWVHPWSEHLTQILSLNITNNSRRDYHPHFADETGAQRSWKPCVRPSHRGAAAA